MDRVTRCLQCGKRMVPCASYNGAHRVEMRILRPAGPDGDGRDAEMGRWPACYSYFRASPLSTVRTHQQVRPCRLHLDSSGLALTSGWRPVELLPDLA